MAYFCPAYVIPTILLLASSLAATAMAKGEDRFIFERSKAKSIKNAWTKMYGLYNKDKPPAVVTAPMDPKILRAYPWAPHLENCVERTIERRTSEFRGADRSPPSWTCEGNVTCNPSPPWIRGADSDNLHKTRLAQDDIWRMQFPRNCSALDKVFLVAKWPEMSEYDLASQIHIMGAYLSVAMYFDRVFVPLPGSFQRASHSGCTGSNKGSWDCYFFPLVSKECEERAMSLMAPDSPSFYSFNDTDEAMLSEIPVITIEYPPFDWHTDSNVAEDWEEPWTQDPETVELLGDIAKLHPDSKKANWWRAQAARFFFRWPSSYMCHLANIARHSAFGHQVASAHLSQLQMVRSTEKGDIAGVNFTAESLASTIWQKIPPFLPRPIVSVHAVQPNISLPKTEVNFAVYGWVAEVLKLHEPGMHSMWLTTYVKNMLWEAKTYSHWNIYHIDNPRGKVNPDFEFEKKAGIKVMMESELVNVLIASDCDLFVGALETEMSRLINELRSTGGRLLAGYVSINLEEFEDVDEGTEDEAEEAGSDKKNEDGDSAGGGI